MTQLKIIAALAALLTLAACQEDGTATPDAATDAPAATPTPVQ
ncbi:hypothetical protein [Jannaschia sp. LMIT008]|nr:hypothetical protein [Jannaschia sp. LMIT008]